jgi:hypothetical protein
MMRVLALCFALYVQSTAAQVAYLIDDFIAAHEPRVQTVTVLWADSATVASECFNRYPLPAQVLMAATISFPMACASWGPSCSVALPTWASDLMVGHEAAHCWLGDFHDALGIPYPVP